MTNIPKLAPALTVDIFFKFAGFIPHLSTDFAI